jgi:serine/threonine-protein phosphatase 2A regulatory subunit A
MTWLGDKIHNIREAAVINLAELATTFGRSWAAEQVLPKIVALYGHSHFLYRLTSVASLHALSAQVEQNIFESVILPTLLKSAEDPVPNIRIRVATVLGIVGQKCKSQSQCDSVVKPVLTRMMQDSDRDVKYFAEKSIGVLDMHFK